VNVIYAFQNFADVHVELAGERPAGDPERRDAAVTWTAFDFSFQAPKYDLTLMVVEDADLIRFTLEYDGSLFRAPTIREQLQTIADFAGMIAGMADP
jgi:hypothetical protein